MKAVILARVSTEEQMNEGQSIPAQLERARNYVSQKGFEIQSEYKFNESSLKDQRVKFEEVIKEIKKSKEKIALIVETVDRLQRSFKESVLLDALRKEDKVELHFIRENLVIHKNSNSSEIQRWDLAVFVAKSYVLQISDNVKRSFEQKISKGEIVRMAPIGYLNHTDDNGEKIAIPDPDRAEHIKKIFELYSTGKHSMEAIAKIMEKDGLRSNGPKSIVLKVRQIEIILKNPFYYGLQRYKGQLSPHKYQPLISEELFTKCQKVRQERYTGDPKISSNPFVFQSMIKCHKCGCSITPEIAKGRYVYYHCTNYHKNCEKIYVPENKILEQIQHLLDNLGLPNDIQEKLVIALRKNEESKNLYHKNQLAKLRIEYDKIDNYLALMYEDRLTGRLTGEEYDKRVSDYKTKQRELLEKMKQHDSANEKYYITANKVLSLAQRARQIFDSSEVTEKKQLLDYLLQNPTLDGEKLNFELKTPFKSLYLYNTKTPSQREAFLWGAQRESNPH